jgi:hypothetical protein
MELCRVDLTGVAAGEQHDRGVHVGRARGGGPGLKGQFSYY